MQTSKCGKLQKKEKLNETIFDEENSIDIIQRRKTLVTTKSMAKTLKENFKWKLKKSTF